MCRCTIRTYFEATSAFDQKPTLMFLSKDIDITPGDRSTPTYLLLECALKMIDVAIRTYVLYLDAETLFARTDSAGRAARYVSVRLSRGQCPRHLRGSGSPARVLYQSLSLEGSFHHRSAQPILRLFERTRSRSVERPDSHSPSAPRALSGSHHR